MKVLYNEFHISRNVRDVCKFDETLYSSTGNVIFADFKAVHNFQMKLNKYFDELKQVDKKVSAGSLNAMGLIDEIFHYVCALYRKNKAPDTFKNLLSDLDLSFGKDKIDGLLLSFMDEFPPVAVYQNRLSKENYLFQVSYDSCLKTDRDNREQVLEELIMLHLANENPAFHPFCILFNDKKLLQNPDYTKTWNQIKAYFLTQPVFGPKNNSLINMLKEPVVASPTSLKGQLDYIRTYWTDILGEWLLRLLEGIDTISEEEKAAWCPTDGGSVELSAYTYEGENLSREYERFSPDRDWMPKVVLMAKTVLVWLYQLSRKYGREISRLDQIPDEELDILKNEGFTGLWLIGLWERSNASKRIKQINGNPEAAASAYSLLDYEIAGNLGGWKALENLRYRCWVRGIRLASDMVPNHTGMDGNWVTEHPDYFISTKDCPFPQYTFNGENLSHDSRVSIYLEDHYYSKTDCAVCFKRVDNQTGDVTYIYHGNDGTGMPWNDTAQIDFLNAEAREAVMQKILAVARNFPIIRFDAAMVLAKKHIRRLWYPEPGHGGDIASRSRYALSVQQFEERIPNEFWREVVDRCANEMPDTLLLAEAFWMMEGYFTRTLGMHRVYNSAFMNMLKKEENQKYRDTVKNTIRFDPQVLKRFVNFMNNPDEETAVAQFGKGDKYFGVCTLMVTMPGLPMFGHGQLEGFEEKYGMEYTRAYKEETPDEGLLNRHWHDIFPLMKKRYLFANVENFLFYDVWNNGVVNENIFAYSNMAGDEKTIVFYNNKYERTQGWIRQSCEYAVKVGSGDDDKQMWTKGIGEALNLSHGDNRFVIFREHRSGLWFVRRSSDILDHGLFVMLNGFEAQVYLDIREVVDSADGKYAKLNDLLNGSGTQDLDVLWQEYHYRELYDALDRFLTSDFIAKIHELFTPKSNGVDFKALLKSVEKDALAYYEVETRFANEGVVDEKRILSQKEARSLKKAVTATPKQKFNAFKRQVEYLYDTFLAAQGSDVQAEKKSMLKVTLETEIYEGLMENKGSAEILVAFAAVNSCEKENCMKWGFTRKLSEILSRSGVINSEIRNIWDRIFVCMRILGMNFGASAFVKSTYEVAKLFVESEYSRLLSGANVYNGIRWFNKECIESSFWYGLASNAMRSQRVLRDQIYRLFRTLEASKELAEYKCDNFTSAVKPVKMPTARKKTVRKSEKQKSDSTEKSGVKKDN